MDRIDLNSASLEDLTRVGISKERAQLLLDYRDEHGPMGSWDDVRSVTGFSQRQIERLKRSGAVLFHKDKAA